MENERLKELLLRWSELEREGSTLRSKIAEIESEATIKGKEQNTIRLEVISEVPKNGQVIFKIENEYFKINEYGIYRVFVGEL